jgi:gas vesicle protein
MKISHAAFLLLTGVALGGLAGLLLAPDEGAKTRKKWMKKARKYKKTAEDKASEFKNKAVDLKENIEGAAQDLKKRFS